MLGNNNSCNFKVHVALNYTAYKQVGVIYNVASKNLT